MACCDVCVETFNKSSRKEIPCSTCNFKVCTGCFEQYQADNSGLYEVSCMSCKQLWDDQFVREHIPQSIVKRLTATTKKRLRDEETAFMPETQEYIEYGRIIETVKVDEYMDVVGKMTKAQFELARLEITPMSDRNAKTALRTQIDRYKASSHVLKDRIEYWHRNKRMSRYHKDIIPPAMYEKLFGNDYHPFDDEAIAVSSVPHEPTILCPCPVEECRGFVTRRTHKCGICDHGVCGKCLMSVLEAEDHTCSEENVQTAEFVLKTSKPCPKCAARIHKIDGCDQMWCTHCNTPFSWKTGLEIKGGVIHNPHYYEWARNHERPDRPADQPLDNCEGLPERYHVSRHIKLVFKHAFSFIKEVEDIHRRCVHYQQVEMRGQNRENVDVFRKNFDIRMRWLKNDMTDKSFEATLHRRYKQQLINQRINQVYDLAVTLCSDVFHRLLRENNNTMEIRNTFLREFKEIFVYVNTCFAKLEKVYQNKMPIVVVNNME